MRPDTGKFGRYFQRIRQHFSILIIPLVDTEKMSEVRTESRWKQHRGAEQRGIVWRRCCLSCSAKSSFLIRRRFGLVRRLAVSKSYSDWNGCSESHRSVVEERPQARQLRPPLQTTTSLQSLEPTDRKSLRQFEDSGGCGQQMFLSRTPIANLFDVLRNQSGLVERPVVVGVFDLQSARCNCLAIST